MPEPEAPKPVVREIVELPMVEVSDFYTFWESLAWHFKSRRSRLVMGGLLAIILVQAKPFGISEDQANKLAEYIMYLVGIMVAALTGDRFIPNGNGNAAKTENDELLKRLDEALAKLEREQPPQ